VHDTRATHTRATHTHACTGAYKLTRAHSYTHTRAHIHKRARTHTRKWEALAPHPRLRVHCAAQHKLRRTTVGWGWRAPRPVIFLGTTAAAHAGPDAGGEGPHRLPTAQHKLGLRRQSAGEMGRSLMGEAHTRLCVTNLFSRGSVSREEKTRDQTLASWRHPTRGLPVQAFLCILAEPGRTTPNIHREAPVHAPDYL